MHLVYIFANSCHLWTNSILSSHPFYTKEWRAWERECSSCGLTVCLCYALVTSKLIPSLPLSHILRQSHVKKYRDWQKGKAEARNWWSMYLLTLVIAKTLFSCSLNHILKQTSTKVSKGCKKKTLKFGYDDLSLCYALMISNLDS